MSQFIESIKLQDGHFSRLPYHQDRVDRTYNQFFADSSPFLLADYLRSHQFPVSGLFKCRLVYDGVSVGVEFQPYQMKKISSLMLVSIDLQSSFYKSLNREVINNSYEQRGVCDDVLFVRNGFVTDSSYCNVAFGDGENWVTPRVPLLYGTQRAYLLDMRVIKEMDVKVADIKNYPKIRLFNAMIEFGEIEFSTNMICFDELFI